MKRITVDLTKASTETLDLTDKLNPRVGDGQLSVPLHIIYGTDDSGNDDPVDMRDKDIEFLSQDTNKNDIYVSGAVTTNSKGDDPYNGNVTFVFPEGTFKVSGTYDVDKTMFRIINKADKIVLSTVSVKLNVLEGGGSDYNFDPNKTSYNSRLEDMIKLAHSQMKDKIANADQEAQSALNDAKQKAASIIKDASEQAQDLLDDIKQTNSEAKGNVAGDTAATAKQAKQQANDNAGNIHDLQAEVGDARGRFMTLSDRENKQDFNIDRKEDKANANANYAAQNLRNDAQDVEIAKKANQSFITDYLSKMYFQPEGFESEAALKAKYPTGKEGIFVTVDTGHKWIYANGQWNDCGVYQSAGIADRSLTAQMTKQFDASYNVIQEKPFIVDWTNHTFKISAETYLVEGKQITNLKAGTYSFSDSTDSLIYCVYNPVNSTFSFSNSEGFYSIEDNNYYIAAINNSLQQIDTKFKVINAKNIWQNGVGSLSNYNMPVLQQAICTANNNDYTVDFKNRIFQTYSPMYLFSKAQSIQIEPGTFKLNDNGEFSFLYASWLDNDSKYVIKGVHDITEVPENSWYLGWIDYDRISSSINQLEKNSYDKFKHPNFIMAGKITIDFEKKELIFPANFSGLNFASNFGKLDFVNPIRIPLKASAGYTDDGNVYYITVNEHNGTLEISSNYQEITYNNAYLGWVSLNLKCYDFGQYGSQADLASHPYSNKKISCLGDSITSGGQTDNGGMAISYVNYLGNLINTVPSNDGVSGSHITKGTAGRSDSFVERVESIKDQDVVTIYGGINDFLFDSPLGTMADNASTQTTFYGALKYLVTRLTFNNPNAKLLFITPMKADKYGGTYDANGNVRKNGVNATEEDYVNAIKEVAEYYSIPVLDLFHAGNLNPYIPAQRDMTVDGLHPNEVGAQRLAQTIAHAINNL